MGIDGVTGVDRPAIAVGGIGAIAVGTAGSEKVNFLDIDMAFGQLPFYLPIGNIIALLGFAATIYAVSRAYTRSQELKRRKGDNDER